MSSSVLDTRWAELQQQPMFPRRHPATLRAAWWAYRSLRRARRDLRVTGVQATVSPPPTLPWGSGTGVYGVLARTRPTCLEGALVRQAWLRAHGVERDVVIGVRSAADSSVRAHAWVDGIARPHEYAGYQLIHRLPAR